MENTAAGAQSQREAVAHGDEPPLPPTLATQSTVSTAESTVRTDTEDTQTHGRCRVCSAVPCECGEYWTWWHDYGGNVSTARSTDSSASASSRSRRRSNTVAHRLDTAQSLTDNRTYECSERHSWHEVDWPRRVRPDAEWSSTYNTQGMDERGRTLADRCDSRRTLDDLSGRRRTASELAFRSHVHSATDSRTLRPHTGHTSATWTESDESPADCDVNLSWDSSGGTRTSSFNEHWHNVEGGRGGRSEWAAAHNTLGMDEHGCTVGTADRRRLEKLARKFAPGCDTATQPSETLSTEITCDDDEETPSTRATGSMADCAEDAAHALAHCALDAGAELRSARRAAERTGEQLDELTDAVRTFFRIFAAAAAAEGAHPQQCSRMH